MRNKTKKIVVIGNGFDLRTKVKTTFRDFICFTVYGCILDNYCHPVNSPLFSVIKIREKINESKSYIPNIDIYDDKICYDCRCFADTSLGKFIIKNFSNQNLNELIYPYINSGKNDEEYHNNDELYYEQYARLICELSHTSIVSFVNTELSKSENNIKLWSDVETVIELLITRNPHLKTKYNLSDDDLPKWDNNTLKSFSDGLELFETLLTKYFSVIQNIDITKDYAKTFFNNIINNHIKSLIQRSHGVVNEDIAKELLDISNADIIINYNYTNIAKRLFKEMHSPQQEVKIVHINGSIQPEPNAQSEFETNIVIGYTNFSDEDVPKDLYSFEKTCRRIIKNTEYVDINNFIGDGWFDLIIIGHSCGMADSDVLGKLLSHTRLNNAVVLCHTRSDLVSNFNNVKKILDSENKKNREDKSNNLNTFSDLMSYTAIFRYLNDNNPANNQFFAVERPEENTENSKENRENIDTKKHHKVKLFLCLLGACLVFILGVYLV